ncbi:radical SAM family heme chaperone HemW [Thiolapillus sp.]|uniref:radical SAM family heme chaperone HemW n=2 Tax=Thiolapillus sp. TaxID=2017437 RepID=UPI003AF62330
MTAPEPGDVPLSLYVHIPWCVRKCPYCDFNSHALKEVLPEQDYVQALLTGLRQQQELAAGREITSVFIGGGTPSLFSGAAIAKLLQGIRNQLVLAKDIEITLEANPGAVDAGHFAEYRAAGVNRLSIGVQSFNAVHLHSLGRIHDPGQALQAFRLARSAGFRNINIDLMFGLPQQTPEQALADLQQAARLAPEHISWYQLTFEPNTLFYHQPPPTPDDEQLWEIQQQGQGFLRNMGYAQYEVSAFSQKNGQCRHNLNYWMFGDYLAIGAGAHAKVSTEKGVIRYARERHPQTYMLSPGARISRRQLEDDDLKLEFMMNALRLTEGVDVDLFGKRTGMAAASIAESVDRARQLGLLEKGADRFQTTSRGQMFLNDLLVLFDKR